MSVVTHQCAAPGCSAWGLYGEGVQPRKGKPGIWWCPAHVPPRLLPPSHPKRRNAPEAVASEVSPAGRAAAVQGGLF